MNVKLRYVDGIKDGLPICFAYLAVSFSFGLVATRGGLPVWLVTAISATNLTSAGQFAGVNMMLTLTGIFELALAVLVINARYMLMSLSISQQLEEKVALGKRLIMSCFITDEIFAVASSKRNRLNFLYFLGLATTPYVGWTVGTLLGGLVNSALPVSLQNAVGIALYCMFIAIIIPPATSSRPVLACVIIAAALSCMLFYIPVINKISVGFRVIICSVVASAIAALLFPVKSEDANKGSKTPDGLVEDGSQKAVDGFAARSSYSSDERDGEGER